MEIVDIDAPDQHLDLVQTAFDEVLRPSFSTEELPGLATIAGGLRSGAVLSVAVDDDGRTLAASFTEHDPESGIDLLGYLATRPGLRSKGTGSRMLDHVAGRWQTMDRALVLGEIHDPRAWPDEEDEKPGARLRFYERWGCGVLDVPWVQPSLGAGLERVSDMLLIVLHPRREPAAGPGRFPASSVRSWIEVYFEATEGQVPSDPIYLALMERLDRPEVAILPLSEFGSVEPLRV